MILWLCTWAKWWNMHLSLIHISQVLDLMQKLKEQYNTSMLMITHDLGIVAEVCDEVSIMYAGRIVEHGNLEDIFENTSHPYTEGLFGSLQMCIRDRDCTGGLSLGTLLLQCTSLCSVQNVVFDRTPSLGAWNF